MILPELLSDPVRARIYIETLVNKEVTAQDLMKKAKISRSTLSHHLTRLVESDVFSVRVGSEKYHRLVKYYSINPDFRGDMRIDPVDDPDGTRRRIILESSAAHLNVISNLILEKIDKPRKTKDGVTFTFSFLSKDEASIWIEEFEKFQKRIKLRLGKKANGLDDCSFIAFGGITPTS